MTSFSLGNSVSLSAFTSSEFSKKNRSIIKEDLERIIRPTIYLRKNDELTAPFANPIIQLVMFHI